MSYARWIEAIERDPLAARGRRASERHLRARSGSTIPRNHNALSGPLTLQLQRALGALDRGSRRAQHRADRCGANTSSVGGDWEMMRDRAHTYAERAEGRPPPPDSGAAGSAGQFGGIVRQIGPEPRSIVIAAVNGHAAGVALAWALQLRPDLRGRRAGPQLASPPSRASGLVPQIGTNWALARRLGYAARARGWCFGGAPLGRRARRRNAVVNAAVPREQLLAHPRWGWAERIEKLRQHVAEMTKPMLRAACGRGASSRHFLCEEYAEPNTFTTRAHQETVRALLGKQERALPAMCETRARSMRGATSCMTVLLGLSLAALSPSPPSRAPSRSERWRGSRTSS